MENNLQFAPEMDSFELEMEQVTEISGEVVSINIFNSSFDVSENPWDDKSVNNGLFAFKVGKYSRTSKHLNANYDFRIGVAQNGGVAKHFRYPVNVAYPYDTDRMRIMFVKPRIIFEDEANKSIVTHFRLYEKAVVGNETERELWVEIKTASGYQVADAFLNVSVDGGEFSEIALEQKEYTTFSAQSGFDSLTVYSMDWGNKNAVLSLDSRATAEGATVGGTGNRVDGVDADGGGTGNTVNGTASIVRGTTNNEQGYYNAVFGNKHEFLGTTAQSNIVGGGANKIQDKATYNIVGGNGNTVGGSSNVVGGGGGNSTVTGGYDLSVGYAQYVTGEGSGNIGHYNRIIHKQAQTFGRWLATGRNYQTRVGVGAERDADGNAKDKTSMFVVSNGAENGSNGVDIFAVSNAYSGDATNGYYAKATKPNDGITLGYFNNNLMSKIKQDVIAALPVYGGEVESV